MKSNRTITTREDSGESSTVDSRFSLFYGNTNHENGGLYSVIGDNNNTWSYEDDKSNGVEYHIPAENTVFINANIALTDGSSKKFDTTKKTPRTIPNLYDALTALAEKISNINTEINKDYSTSDKYLYVTKNDSDKTVTIFPGNGEDNMIATGTNSTLNSIQITSGNNSTSIKITNNDIEFTIKPHGNTNSHTYTLGAIIEAIQELNRRTAFIDSTMTFTDAKNHFDVNEDEVTDAFYQGLDDELPAATNSHQGTLEPNIKRSIPSSKLAKMNIIAHNPETVNNSGKNIQFTQETLILNDSTILDDPTVISPEYVAVRMRGCPYLLE